ncbi:MAG: FMN-binding protein [Candidatus Izemoplasmatales bacterium]
MKPNLRMILFVFVMAIITSGILLGVEAITAERIKNNQDAKIKIAILEAHDIEYSLTSINNTFDLEIEIITVDDWTFYVNPDTDNVSFAVSGGGVWGPIEGILTLESDFQTILDVSILQQEETPGLGGVIAEKGYLDTFVGKIMIPIFEINKDPSENANNEIDAIVGATNTSKRFQDIMNTDYADALSAWQNRDE